MTDVGKQLLSRGRVAVLASEAALAVAVAVPRAGLGLLMATAGGALVCRPELVVLALFLAVEELPDLSTFYLDAPRALTAGTEVYRLRLAGTPLPLLVLGAAALLLFLRRSSPDIAPPRWNRPTVVALVSLSSWCALLSVVQDEDRQLLSVGAHAVSSAGPWLAALAAYVIGTVVVRDRRHLLAYSIGGALLAKAVLGVTMEILTGGVTVDSQRFVIFYDAALPTLAAAVLVGRLLTDRRIWPGERLVALAATVVVLLSFRRAVWMFVAVAFVAVPLVRRRAIVARRALAVLACGAAVLALAPGGLRGPVVGRVLEAVNVVQGETSERNSSQLHFDDLTVGLKLARAEPWTGIGVRAWQPPGLALTAAPGRYLYVHNDLLQTWLRFGLPGVILLGLLFVHLGWRSLRVLGAPGRLDLLDATGAVFAGGVLIPAMTAAFVTTTWRFPAFLGLAAAVLDYAHDRQAADTASELSVAPGGEARTAA